MRPVRSVLAAIGSAVLLTAGPATAQPPSGAAGVAGPSRLGIGEPRGILLPVVGASRPRCHA